MARLTKIEKFQAKIGIEMDHIKARLIELRAKAKEVKLDARVEFEKGLDALEKTQGEIKSTLDDWAKAGKEAAGDLKKTIKRSTKDLKKSVKDAYKSLT
jgi:gas vesicle protein